MFRPMAITVCSAILGALVLALTVVPVASSYLLKLEGTRARGAVVPAPAPLLRRPPRGRDEPPRRTLAVALAVVTVAMASLAFIGTEFMPRLDEGSILVETRKLPVDLARGVGGHLHAGRADHPALPRGEAGRHQDRPSRRGHRGHGHLPGRRLREPPPHGRVEERLVEGGADRRTWRRRSPRCRASPATSPSRWPCGSTRSSPA